MGEATLFLTYLRLFLLCTASCEVPFVKVAEFSHDGQFTGGEEQNAHRRLQEDGTDLGSALLVAAQNGDVSTVRMLLDGGADPDYMSWDGELTPLIVAAARNHVDVARALLNAGALPGLRSKTRTSALDFAAVRGSLEVLKALLIAGADPNEEDGQGLTAIHLAAIEGNVEVVRALVSAEGDIEQRTGSSSAGDTTLHLAVGGGHVALVRLLLKLGAKVDAQNTMYRQTALQRAAAENSRALIQVLIDEGADVDHVDVDGDSALFTAAYFGNKQAIQELLENGAKRTTRNNKGYTALSAICQCQFVPKVSSRCKVELCKKPKSMIELLNL